MSKRSIVTVVAVVALVLSMSGTAVFAQCGCSSVPAAYVPVVPTYSASYAPAVTYYEPTTAYYAPTVAYYEPTTAYYAPTTAYYAPSAYVSYYAPVAPAVSYYTPYVTSYAAYAPVVTPYSAYYGVPGWSAYGTAKIYVPGEPVRNTLRAITP